MVCRRNILKTPKYLSRDIDKQKVLIYVMKYYVIVTKNEE